VAPAFIDAGPVSVNVNELVIVTVPVALFEVSATLMAVRETFGGAVKTCGAV
jgi:hypothetical protein